MKLQLTTSSYSIYLLTYYFIHYIFWFHHFFQNTDLWNSNDKDDDFPCWNQSQCIVHFTDFSVHLRGPVQRKRLLDQWESSLSVIFFWDILCGGLFLDGVPVRPNRQRAARHRGYTSLFHIHLAIPHFVLRQPGIVLFTFNGQCLSYQRYKFLVSFHSLAP